MAKAGAVKFYNDDRGFGFIKQNRGGKDLFAHVSDLADGQKLVQGDAVRYDEGWNAMKGKSKAVNVTGGSGGPVRVGKGKGKGKSGALRMSTAVSDGKGSGHSSRCKQLGSLQLYHATTIAAADQIKQSRRFKCGTAGFAGGAIYFSQKKDAACRKCFNGRGNAEKVIRCRVSLGKCCSADPHEVDKDACLGMGCNSVKMNANDVYAVFDTARVLILAFEEPPFRPRRSSSLPPQRQTSQPQEVTAPVLNRTLHRSSSMPPGQRDELGSGSHGIQAQVQRQHRLEDTTTVQISPQPPQVTLPSSPNKNTQASSMRHKDAQCTNKLQVPWAGAFDAPPEDPSIGSAIGHRSFGSTIHASYSPSAAPSLQRIDHASAAKYHRCKEIVMQPCVHGFVGDVFSLTLAVLTGFGVGIIGALTLRLPFESEAYSTFEVLNCIVLGLVAIFIAMACLGNVLWRNCVLQDALDVQSDRSFMYLRRASICCWFSCLLGLCLLSVLEVFQAMTQHKGVQDSIAAYVTIAVVLQLLLCSCQGCASTILEQTKGLETTRGDEEAGWCLTAIERSEAPLCMCGARFAIALTSVVWVVEGCALARLPFKYPIQFSSLGKQFHCVLQGTFIIFVSLVVLTDNVYRMPWTQWKFECLGRYAGRSWIYVLLSLCMLSALEVFQSIKQDHREITFLVVIAIIAASLQLCFSTCNCCHTLNEVIEIPGAV